MEYNVETAYASIEAWLKQQTGADAHVTWDDGFDREGELFPFAKIVETAPHYGLRQFRLFEVDIATEEERASEVERYAIVLVEISDVAAFGYLLQDYSLDLINALHAYVQSDEKDKDDLENLLSPCAYGLFSAVLQEAPCDADWVSELDNTPGLRVNLGVYVGHVETVTWANPELEFVIDWFKGLHAVPDPAYLCGETVILTMPDGASLYLRSSGYFAEALYFEGAIPETLEGGRLVLTCSAWETLGNGSYRYGE